MKIKLIVILSIFLLATACQKKKYPEESVQLNQGQIYFNGSLDNQPIALKIGTDGYYCYSSYKQRTDSIYVFEGDLKKVNCNPCPLSLQVQLLDYLQRTPGSSVQPDSVFRAGSRPFIPGIARPATLQFVSHSNKAVASLQWNTSNGSSSSDSMMSCEFSQPGPQTVSLTVLTKGNCESLVVNTIFVDGSSDVFACGITAVLVQNTNSDFSPTILGGKPPFRYTWNFGDGGTSNLSTLPHNYTYAGSYPVKLRVEDAENHVCESNYIHVAGNDPSACTANMSLSYTGRRNAFLNGAKIQWTDQSNVVLSSDSIAQPAQSYFEIVSSKAYEANEQGQAGRLLTLRFNVLLANGSRQVWFKSDNTAIAVTYK